MVNPLWMPTSQCVKSYLDLHVCHAFDLLQAGITTNAERSERFSVVEERVVELNTNEHIFVPRLRNDVELVMFSRATVQT